MTKIFKIGLLLIMLSAFKFSAAQQQITVTGKVTDNKGNPLSGATVSVKGAAASTSTDDQGAYSIAVAGNGTLEVSFISYKAQEVKVGGRSVIDIALEAAEAAMDEVVVVGYGTQKKVNMTGSVASISGERLENRSVPTVTQALQGTVANLNITTPNGAPGTKQNINIRGYTGLQIDENGNKSNVSASPLVVIDGIQGGDLSTINMNDVENISVLKDAASAAIYGSSAPYGVIIVTTKKERKVNLLSATIIILVFPRLPIFQAMLTPWNLQKHLMKWLKILTTLLCCLMMMLSNVLKITRPVKSKMKPSKTPAQTTG